MVNVKYSARIMADADFINWLIEKDKTQFFHLTHIKASSIFAKGENNICCDHDF